MKKDNLWDKIKDCKIAVREWDDEKDCLVDVVPEKRVEEFTGEDMKTVLPKHYRKENWCEKMKKEKKGELIERKEVEKILKDLNVDDLIQVLKNRLKTTYTDSEAIGSTGDIRYFEDKYKKQIQSLENLKDLSKKMK